ncbi:GntR family transcriptional regulator [Aureibacillus halotolerans]|uniref:GntR family transcriptional regulator n=1 Tax=Aureibacillus halotolerans TaxID=1508390 RepID=A0A4R6TXN9_9BACI|nr:GntR family transcriptional regulator [Aureibacillus halotolerans]TDQ37133.1 GntR family transcriptional regulator [Aureibacillus halotolerans]
MRKKEFISEDLLSKIYQNKYRPGEKLPPERELAIQYGVSRYTIREALKKLLNIGCVRTVQGAGIYVTGSNERNPLVYNSLTEKKFKDIDSHIVYLKQVPASPQMAKLFDFVEEGETLWEYQRVRIVEMQKMQIETTRLPVSYFPQLDTSVIAQSVHDFVQQQGYQISHFMTTYRAVNISKAQAEMLNCKKGVAAMEILNRGLLDDGRVFEYSELINLDYACTYFTPFNSSRHQVRKDGY